MAKKRPNEANTFKIQKGPRAVFDAASVNADDASNNIITYES
jgi:hypothetical protein